MQVKTIVEALSYHVELVTRCWLLSSKSIRIPPLQDVLRWPYPIERATEEYMLSSGER